MPAVRLPWGRLSVRAVLETAWACIRIAAGVAVVVVPFGYAITGVHKDVLMGGGFRARVRHRRGDCAPACHRAS